MDTIKIKKATTTDIPQLQAVGRQTFFETFAAHNSAADIQKYLAKSFSAAKLTREVNDQNSEFYFALLDGKVIGYLKINYGRAQTELKDKKSIEIERIYVLKDFHGKKVGQVLFATALNIAMRSKSEYVWLGVWGKNLRAINFYKKNGFVEFDKHVFKLGNAEQTDLMMRLNLS